MNVEKEDGELSVRLNNNSYISLTLMVLVIGATLWIKDGQYRSTAAITETANDLKNYKELQAKDSEILKSKIDAIAKIVESGTSDRWTDRDAKTAWKRFKELNPQINVPDI